MNARVIESGPVRRADVEGWFPADDRVLFTELLSWQSRTQPPGDLVELGAYLGKSAIVIGDHVHDGETFTVCDLFGMDPDASDVRGEVTEQYGGLTRERFEQNYLAFHDTLPVVVQAATSEIGKHVAAGSCRFVHVDASHLYRHVAGDLVDARRLLRPDGLVVVDDFRAEHTPGVAAAVWEAVLSAGLRPVVLSRQKFYGTWGDPEPARTFVEDVLRDRPRWRFVEDEIAGQRVLVVRRPIRRKPAAAPASAAKAEGNTPRRMAAAARRMLRPEGRAGGR